MKIGRPLLCIGTLCLLLPLNAEELLLESSAFEPSVSAPSDNSAPSASAPSLSTSSAFEAAAEIDPNVEIDPDANVQASVQKAREAETIKKMREHRCPTKHVIIERCKGYFELDKNVIEISGDWLYWKANVTNLCPVLTAENIAGAGFDPALPSNVHKQFIEFGYDSGVRASLGYSPSFDHWNFFATWTYFNTSEAEKFSASGAKYFLIPNTTLNAIGSAGSVSAAQKVNLNLLDLAVSKLLYLSKPFVLQPSIGVRLAHLMNKLETTYGDAVPSSTQDALPASMTDVQRIRNTYNAIGLRGALDSEWSAKWGFGFYGNVGASLLWGLFKPHQTETLSADGFYAKYTSSASQHALKSSLDIAAGFHWQIAFNDRQTRIRIRGGYEFNYWWNQVGLANFVATAHPAAGTGAAGLAVDTVGDVGYQGFVTGLEIDF